MASYSLVCELLYFLFFDEWSPSLLCIPLMCLWIVCKSCPVNHVWIFLTCVHITLMYSFIFIQWYFCVKRPVILMIFFSFSVTTFSFPFTPSWAGAKGALSKKIQRVQKKKILKNNFEKTFSWGNTGHFVLIMKSYF